MTRPLGDMRNLENWLAGMGVLAAAFAGAVELDGGWTLAMDPANVGKTNGWAAAMRADASRRPCPA